MNTGLYAAQTTKSLAQHPTDCKTIDSIRWRFSVPILAQQEMQIAIGIRFLTGF